LNTLGAIAATCHNIEILLLTEDTDKTAQKYRRTVRYDDAHAAHGTPARQDDKFISVFYHGPVVSERGTKINLRMWSGPRRKRLKFVANSGTVSMRRRLALEVVFDRKGDLLEMADQRFDSSSAPHLAAQNLVACRGLTADKTWNLSG
jgi:hypothetical protein